MPSQVLHETAYAVFPFGRQQHVDMVGHQDISVYRAAIAPGALS